MYFGCSLSEHFDRLKLNQRNEKSRTQAKGNNDNRQKYEIVRDLNVARLLKNCINRRAAAATKNVPKTKKNGRRKNPSTEE